MDIRSARVALIVGVLFSGFVNAQTTNAKYHICMDIAHKEKFWHDPTHMEGLHPDFVERMKYMTNEFSKTASSVNAEFSYLTDEIKPAHLAKCNLLFIHIPAARYNADEVKAITDYLMNGGSLFLVMDSDYWSTLDQTNVNDIIHPFEIEFAGANPDTLSGGRTKASLVTPKALKIPCHDARIVKGGTPFSYNERSDTFPIGMFADLKNGGRIIVMGDGMVSLYMTSWEGVNDYQCSEFMHDAFKWLLNGK